MSTMTFIGRTTREAMALAKARFGSDVEIVDSRQTSDGVELTANVHNLPLQRRHLQPQVAAVARSQGPAVQPLRAQPAAAHDERSMSTVSFESHVRDRKERLPTVEAKAAPTGSRQQVPHSSGAAHFAQARATAASAPAAQSLSASLAMPVSAKATADAAGRDRQSAANHAAVLDELHSIRQFMAGQLETVRWFDTTRRRPSQMRLLRILMARQFSTVLAKSICDLLPVDFSDAQADSWLQQTLARTLSSFGPAQNDGDDAGPARGSLFDRGGVFALTGPTGVGKTTTVAKIAARFAMQHGAGQVALITADVYRIGAQEQLRSFGQMLGVPVHVAHDRAALKELLGLFGNRKLVLIDTAGVSQRDSRVAQLLAALDLDPIQRVVVLNAALQAASLQDVAQAYRAQDCAGVLLSKTDESVQIGSALDCLIRNRLHLLGFADGQRVPEDFHAADFTKLVACAMAAPEGTPLGDEGLQPSEVQLILESSHV